MKRKLKWPTSKPDIKMIATMIRFRVIVGSIKTDMKGKRQKWKDENFSGNGRSFNWSENGAKFSVFVGIPLENNGI